MLGDSDAWLQPREYTWTIQPPKLRHVVAGPFHVLAKAVTNEVYVWGQGTDFQLGTQKRQNVLQPILLQHAVNGLEDEWLQAAAGWGHTLILTHKK